MAPDGRLLSQAEWDAQKHRWLPTAEDEEFIQSLMTPVTEPGKFAGWIAPPARGINGLPVVFEYVKLAGVRLAGRRPAPLGRNRARPASRASYMRRLSM